MSEFQDLAYKYNQENNYNCAESVLLAGSELYHYEVTPTELHQVGGFGGGMGCGSTCGAITGAIAVLGRLAIQDRAHTTDGFKMLCAGLIRNLKDAYGATDCREIMPKFRSRETGCSPTVAVALEVLDAYLKENGLISK